MPRKSAKTPVVVPAPIQEKPAIVLPPKTEVKGEGTYSDDGNKTTNELVVQKVSVPFVFKQRGTTKTEFKDYLRIFVRPDESHDEPDARWDTHESDDEAALKQLFTTYGKGHGTTISVRLNVDGTGKDEFFLDVLHPKPDDDADAKHPSVLVDYYGGTIGSIVFDLFHETSNVEPPKDFMSREALEKSIEEMKENAEAMEPIEDVLDEFDMPGDLPGHIYTIADRLRAIFQRAKGLDK